jgi:hypothetical protein
MAPVVDFRAADRKSLLDVLVAKFDLTNEAVTMIDVLHDCMRTCLAAGCTTSRQVLTVPKFEFHSSTPIT